MAAVPTRLSFFRTKMFLSIFSVGTRYSSTKPTSLPDSAHSSSSNSSSNSSSSFFYTPTQIPRASPHYITPSFLDDPIAAKFINCMMWDGKKSLSQTIFKKALEIVKVRQMKLLSSSPNEDILTDPLTVFHKALENATPHIGTTVVRRGGKAYHIPKPLTQKRKRFLGIKWLITAARERPGDRRTLDMSQRLAAEIIDAYNHEGAAIKQKKELHRLAEANRAFIHYRW